MGEGMSRRMMKAGIEVWGYRRNYEKANLYLLKDPEDQELFKRYQSYMKKTPRNELLQLKFS